MEHENVVKIDAYPIDADDHPEFGTARTKQLGDAGLASTAVLNEQFISPEWRFEIDTVASARG